MSCLVLRPPMLVMIVAVSPSAASAADGDELGTVIAAWGDPERAPRRRRASRTPSPRTPPADPASSPTSTRPRPSPSGWACLRRRRADGADGRAGAARPLRALPPAAPARRARRRRLVGPDAGLRPRGGPRAGVPPARVSPRPRRRRSARRVVAVARARPPPGGPPAVPDRRHRGSVPRRGHGRGCRVHAMGPGSPRDLRRLGGLRRQSSWGSSRSRPRSAGRPP